VQQGRSWAYRDGNVQLARHLSHFAALRVARKPNSW
jgi:hypothetical protein